MNKTLFINITLQFIAGCVLVLFLKGAMGYSDENFGFVIGRALAGVIIPLVINAIPALIYKGITKKRMPIFYISLWIIWVLLTFMSIYGDIMFTVENSY